MWDAIKTPQTVQFRHLKDLTPSWMVITEAVRAQLLNVLPRLADWVFTCLLFKMGDGVQPVLQQKRHSTNMARAVIARMTEEEALGQTMFTLLKVSRCMFTLCKNCTFLPRIVYLFLI